MSTIQTRINEIRQAKHVPIAIIERNGISRTKYFAFVRGERDLSLADLHVLLDVLSISFSELLMHTNEFDSWVITDIMTTRYETPTYITLLKDQALRDFENEGYYGNQQLAWLYDVIFRIQSGLDVKEPVDALYNDLKKYKYFSFFEMRIFAIISPFLTPKRFYKLYRIYSAGVYSFRYFIPEEMLKIMRHINAAAFQFLTNRSVKSATQIKFVLDALVAHPRRNVNAELHLGHRFGGIMREYLFGDRAAAVADYENYHAAAMRQGIGRTVLDDHAVIDYQRIWQLFIAKSDKVIDDLDSHPEESFKHLEFRQLSENYGAEIKRLLDAKKISIRETEKVGFSRTRMYRILNNESQIYVSELLTFMRLGRIEPGDVDALLSFHSGSRSQELLSKQFSANPDLEAKMKAAYASYEKTGLRLQLEYALLFKTLHDQRSVPMWPISPEAETTAVELNNLLFDMEEWDEQEHRLVEYSLLNIETAGEAVVRLTAAAAMMQNRDVFHTITNSVLKNSESVLFKMLLNRDQAGYERIIQLVQEALLADPHILDFAVWRWRWELYQNYGQLFTEPKVALQRLRQKLDDYVILTGNQFILANYENALRDLTTVYVSDFDGVVDN
jgi:transcriptional regulator with XRE-family HTH domain